MRDWRGEMDLDKTINHPPYYTQGAIECINALRSALSLEGFVSYCRGAAIKYAWRAGLKGDAEEDLRKGAWYLTRAADELNKEKHGTQ